MRNPSMLARLAPLCTGVFLLAGCPDQDGVGTSTSATESSTTDSAVPVKQPLSMPGL